jgi:DnaJ-class molecular chaperone
MEKNLYEVLGVDEKASQEDIKRAYRKLSLQNHPDRNNNSPESTAKFQSISTAYEVIGDEDKRRQYDMKSQNPFGMGGGMGMGGMGMGGPTFFTSNVEIDPADIFKFFSNNFFNGGPGGGSGSGGMGGMPGMRMGPNMFNMENLKQRLAKPTPIIKTETISLNKAYTGYNMPIEITRWIVENDMKREETETIYIPIPKGIDNNELIILREKGNMLNETNKGDIKVFIKIQNDTEFIRNGLDLVLNKSISLKEALCGFTIEMNYLDGRIFKINSNSGSVIANNSNKVLNGYGMKRDDHVGNLIINFNIVFPEKLSEEQIQGLQKIL